MIFELLTPENNVNAYSILSQRINSLINNGFKQYVQPYPDFNTYSQRTILKQNWILRYEGSICGIVSLIADGMDSGWKEYYSPSNYYWISSLFVSEAWKYKKIGKILIEECVNISKKHHKEELLLDCYTDSGFLEEYYLGNKFITIGKKLFIYPGREFNAALMKREIM
jgi:hypothetical protein